MATIDRDGDEPPAKRARTQGRRPLPPWLLAAFKAIAAECDQRNAAGLPPLYSIHQTVFYPRPSTYFLLQGKLLSPTKMYNPQFFVWDPLVLYKLPCPICGSKLHRHGVVDRPRRCVGAMGPIWIIRYRYLCSSCRHPRTQKQTVTFRSWDTRILNILPPALSAEFPARLTRRSGISKDLLMWMRACLANGMGPKQFSDALRVVYMEKHDLLHLQYLYLIQESYVRTWAEGVVFQSFLPFDDVSSNGFHGFVPSSQWLRDVYDTFIEEHLQDFDQHCAMLSGEIYALDHSHKVCLQQLHINYHVYDLCRSRSILHGSMVNKFLLPCSRSPTRKVKSVFGTHSH
jgi:transposase-like protein